MQARECSRRRGYVVGVGQSMPRGKFMGDDVKQELVWRGRCRSSGRSVPGGCVGKSWGRGAGCCRRPCESLRIAAVSGLGSYQDPLGPWSDLTAGVVRTDAFSMKPAAVDVVPRSATCFSDVGPGNYCTKITQKQQLVGGSSACYMLFVSCLSWWQWRACLTKPTKTGGKQTSSRHKLSAAASANHCPGAATEAALVALAS